MPELISSIDEMITKLGGPTKAAEALGATSPQQVVNWRGRGKISPRLFLQHQEALRQRGLSAPPSLWDQSEMQQ